MDRCPTNAPPQETMGCISRSAHMVWGSGSLWHTGSGFGRSMDHKKTENKGTEQNQQTTTAKLSVGRLGVPTAVDPPQASHTY